jgi:hypothetical protein
MKHVTITDEVDHAYGAAIVALSDVQFHNVAGKGGSSSTATTGCCHNLPS